MIVCVCVCVCMCVCVCVCGDGGVRGGERGEEEGERMRDKDVGCVYVCMVVVVWVDEERRKGRT